jgi:hypothetical protein
VVGAVEADVRFLAVSSNVDDPTPFLAAESARVAELQDSGVFERVLLKADWSGAVILVSASNADEARAALDSLPTVTNGVTAFDLTPVIDPPPVAAAPHAQC